MMMSITEKIKKIIRTNQMGINQVLSLVCWSKAKRGERLFSMQIISQEKDLAVGISGFEGVGPEWLLPKKKESLFTFLEESKIWRGREGNWSTGACLLYYLSFFLNFLSFLLCFLSYLFSLFFLLQRKKWSVFLSFFQGTARALL